jgi:hypothetical protein
VATLPIVAGLPPAKIGGGCQNKYTYTINS